MSARDPSKAKDIEKTHEFTEMVKNRRTVLVRLNGWMSAGIITTTAALLIHANMLYIKAGQYAWPWLTALLICLVTAIGLYVIVRSVYIVTRRTENALEAVRGPRQKPRLRLEGVLLFMVMLSAIIAPWLAGYTGAPVFVISLIGVTFVYLVSRVAYWQRRYRAEQAAKSQELPSSSELTKKIAAPIAKAGEPAAVGEDTATTGSIRLFWVGKLPETTYSVVLLAVLGALFAGLTMEKPMIDGVRIALTLILGGFYPAVILLGLSYSVAAHVENYSIPGWLTKSFWQYVP
jgi:hypothetical protein